MTDNLRFVPAWKRNDPKLQADALALWQELRMLPPDIDLVQRATQLVVSAYIGARLVGVTTAEVQTHPPVRQRFAFGRILLRPEVEKAGIVVPMTIAMREELREWSKANPQKKVAGFAIAISAKGYGKTPVTAAGLVHAGYNADGQQVRLYWWDHYRLPVA
ncbi:MAG: hypothetical protein Q7T44_12875 [Parvibaculum sp.]|nr:hypothetical protein [Parvibaculum sp.]